MGYAIVLEIILILTYICYKHLKKIFANYINRTTIDYFRGIAYNFQLQTYKLCTFLLTYTDVICKI